MAAMAAMLTSCSKDDAFGGLSHGKVTFEVSTPELATRAYGDGKTANNLYYAVYDVTENAENGAMVKTNYATDDTTDGVTFANGSLTTKVSIDLVEGRNYEVAFWAESANSPYVFNTDPAKKSVSYNDDVTLTANNEDYDAFFAYVPKEQVKVGHTVSVTLKRPFAQLNVATNDTDNAKEPLGVTVAKTGVKVYAYTSFDLKSGDVIGEKKELTFDMKNVGDDIATEVVEHTLGTISANNNNYDWLTMNYILVNERENIDVTFLFEDNKGKTDYTRPYAAVPVERNHKTNIIGSILTSPTDFSVTIDKDFSDPDINEERNNRREVATTEEFVDAFGTLTDDDPDNDVDEVVLTGDVVIDENFNWSQFFSYNNSTTPTQVVTRANEVTGEVNSLNIPAGKTFTLDLNGCTISATENSTGSYGLININPGAELTITDSKGDGAIRLKALQNRGWNGYSSVISNQRGKLTVNGGTIEHLGDTDMAYGIDILTNTGAENVEATINGGTIKSTYRAIRQFLNSTKAQNILTVNGGTIESTGGNKSIWMQNANANNNPGTLVVKENAVLNSDVLISYSNAANDYISASVAAKALKGDSEVLLSNAPAGYAVKKIDGVWTVTKAVSAAAFLDAVKNVKDGDTITLDSDIIFTKDARTLNSGTWYDGLYYVGDKSFTIDLNGYTICQDGAVNDYLLNFKNEGSKANTITIKNGTIDAGTAAYCALCCSSTQENKLTINLEGVTLYNNNSGGATIKWRGGAELNVKAGTKIIGKDSYVGIECYNSNVNIYDGAEIYQNGTSSYVGCLVGVSGNGTVNVYGGYGKGAQGGFIAMTSGGTINVYGGQWIANTDGTYANGNKSVLIAQSEKGAKSIVNVTGGTFKGGYNCYGGAVGDAQINISGGNFNADPSGYLAEGYLTLMNNNIWTVRSSTLESGEYDGTLEFKGDLIINGDVTIKTLKATNGGTIKIANDKTLTLTNFSFGSKDNASAKYEIKGGTVVANYGFFQHGKYALHSNFETGYMYYSYGSDITVYGTFHSQGKGDGLDYVRGKLTIAKGGKSLHDKSLWVGQPASWGAMAASLIIEDGGYVQANSLSVYEGSSLTYYNDADLKYNSVTGTEYITKATKTE